MPERMMPFCPSFETCFIIRCISRYCFTRRLISSTEVPEPDAMRRRGCR